MHTNVRWAIGILAAVAGLGMTTPAFSGDGRDDRRHDRRHDRHDRHRGDWHRSGDHRHGDRDWRRSSDHHHWDRRDWYRHHAPSWQLHHGHGWRYEHRPGFWSPHFVWWLVDGRPLLRPIPTVRIVRYRTGYYELLGDGFRAPFYWVWRPTVVAVAPPPVPLPPLPPAEYPFPPAGYPPPPSG